METLQTIVTFGTILLCAVGGAVSVAVMIWGVCGGFKYLFSDKK